MEDKERRIQDLEIERQEFEIAILNGSKSLNGSNKYRLDRLEGKV